MARKPTYEETKRKRDKASHRRGLNDRQRLKQNYKPPKLKFTALFEFQTPKSKSETRRGGSK